MRKSKETRLDLLQRVSKDLGWHIDSRGRYVVEVEIEILLDWILEDCKAQAAVLLEKGPKDYSDQPLSSRPEYFEGQQVGFNKANARWRTIIKEYLG